jgi:hypothetical protein
MTFKEITAVYSDNHIKTINMICEQTKELYGMLKQAVHRYLQVDFKGLIRE